MRCSTNCHYRKQWVAKEEKLSSEGEFFKNRKLHRNDQKILNMVAVNIED
jgi:hypothetical protein